MNDSGNKSKATGAFILGTAIGAALGILLAPDKGCETRKKLFGALKGFVNEPFDEINRTFSKEPDDPEKDRPV
jgi:gas vesicle protein